MSPIATTDSIAPESTLRQPADAAERRAPSVPVSAGADYASESARWQALRSRDPKADGHFVYSVRTSGVFCRPSCAARAARLQPASASLAKAQAAWLLLGDTPARGKWRRISLAEGVRAAPGEAMLVDAEHKPLLALHPLVLVRRPSPEAVEELFTLATAFASQPLPRGNRVAIVTNAGGPGILATDVLANGGMLVADLTEETRETMRKVLPAEASVRNPVDIIATSGPEQYETCVRAALLDPGGWP